MKMKTITYTVLGIAILTPSLASACLSDWGFDSGYGMMGYGGGAGAFMVTGGIVWTVVGISLEFGSGRISTGNNSEILVSGAKKATFRWLFWHLSSRAYFH